MQRNRWLHLSSSLWEILFRCDMLRERIDQKKFPRWSVKYFFSPNLPIIQKSHGEGENGENRPMQSVLLFKQAKKARGKIKNLYVIITFKFSEKNYE